MGMVAAMKFTQRILARYPTEMDALRALVVVDPLTGYLSRRTNSSVSKRSRLRLFHTQFYWNGRKVLASHVAWALTHGEWPPSRVYHRNRIGGDNRPVNLTLDPKDRVKVLRTSYSIQKGVVKSRKGDEWLAYAVIRPGEKRRLLGRYPDRLAAVQARAEHVYSEVL